MSLQIVLLSCVVLAVAADRAPYGSPPAYPPPPSYHPAPSYHAAPEYPDVPPQYTYTYGVADDYSGTKFDHSEARDGYKTEGSYTVNLPDGRIQTVRYVDNGEGLVAEVTYEGEAVYPEYKPAYPAPPPVYA